VLEFLGPRIGKLRGVSRQTQRGNGPAALSWLLHPLTPGVYPMAKIFNLTLKRHLVNCSDHPVSLSYATINGPAQPILCKHLTDTIFGLPPDTYAINLVVHTNPVKGSKRVFYHSAACMVEVKYGTKWTRFGAYVKLCLLADNLAYKRTRWYVTITPTHLV